MRRSLDGEESCFLVLRAEARSLGSFVEDMGHRVCLQLRSLAHGQTASGLGRTRGVCLGRRAGCRSGVAEPRGQGQHPTRRGRLMVLHMSASIVHVHRLNILSTSVTLHMS